MKSRKPYTVSYYSKATGINHNCIHMDLRVPKGTKLVVGHVLFNDISNNNNSNEKSMVIRKLYRNLQSGIKEYDAWHIWVSFESRSVNKLRNKYNVLCNGWTENGKLKWDILCSRKHSQGESMKVNGGLEVFMDAGNLGNPLPSASSPNASDNLGDNL